MALGYGNKYFGSGGGGGGGVTAPVAVAEGGTGADQSAIAKGGLLVGTAAGTIGIKAVGADGQVLTASAAAAGGVAWAAAGAAAAGGADTQIQYNDAGAVNGHAAFTLAKASGAVGLTAPFTLTPGSDIVPLTVRASAAGGTANILQIQTALNAPLITVAHDGTMTGNLTGDVTGNADTATDGLSTASGTAPLTLTLAAKGLTGSVAVMTGDAGAGGTAGTVPAPAIGDATKYLKGDGTWAAGGGGVTNSAGANVVTKSDGTNIVATALSEASAGAFATSAGTALGLTATAPAATTGASQAGVGVTITASPAVASTDTAGAATGGPVSIVAGASARFTSGNAVGSDVLVKGGAGIGTYSAGMIRGDAASGSGAGIRLTQAGDTPLTWIYRSTNDFWKGSLGAAGVNVSSANYYGIAAGTTETVTPDTLWRRRAAANPAWGAASATPVAYLHSLAADARAGTDTNTAGANATLAPGNGTGTGAASALIIQTPAVVASGTGAQTLTQRVSVKELHINLTLGDVAVYANNAAALAGGLVAGDLYRTGADPDPVCIVH